MYKDVKSFLTNGKKSRPRALQIFAGAVAGPKTSHGKKMALYFLCCILAWTTAGGATGSPWGQRRLGMKLFYQGRIRFHKTALFTMEKGLLQARKKGKRQAGQICSMTRFYKKGRAPKQF